MSIHHIRPLKRLVLFIECSLNLIQFIESIQKPAIEWSNFGLEFTHEKKQNYSNQHFSFRVLFHLILNDLSTAIV